MLTFSFLCATNQECFGPKYLQPSWKSFLIGALTKTSCIRFVCHGGKNLCFGVQKPIIFQPTFTILSRDFFAESHVFASFAIRVVVLRQWSLRVFFVIVKCTQILSILKCVILLKHGSMQELTLNHILEIECLNILVLQNESNFCDNKETNTFEKCYEANSKEHLPSNSIQDIFKFSNTIIIINL